MFPNKFTEMLYTADFTRLRHFSAQLSHFSIDPCGGL